MSVSVHIEVTDRDVDTWCARGADDVDEASGGNVSTYTLPVIELEVLEENSVSGSQGFNLTSSR